MKRHTKKTDLRMLDENPLHRRNTAEHNSNYGVVTSLPKPARSPTFKKEEK